MKGYKTEMKGNPWGFPVITEGTGMRRGRFFQTAPDWSHAWNIKIETM
ncbi:hypothetical protein [Lacrimispora indolis]|nr:hypothetical protein [[Clostridium] methoxybenzovorans]